MLRLFHAMSKCFSTFSSRRNPERLRPRRAGAAQPARSSRGLTGIFCNRAQPAEPADRPDCHARSWRGRLRGPDSCREASFFHFLHTGPSFGTLFLALSVGFFVKYLHTDPVLRPWRNDGFELEHGLHRPARSAFWGCAPTDGECSELDDWAQPQNAVTPPSLFIRAEGRFSIPGPRSSGFPVSVPVWRWRSMA